MPTGKAVLKKPSVLKHGCLKKPAAGFIPKRGKARLAYRRPASKNCMKKPVGYTRVPRPGRNLQRDLKPSITIADFFKGNRWTTNYLIANKFLHLPKTCSKCGSERMICNAGIRFGPRATSRCTNRSCRHRLSIFTDNPYFVNRTDSIDIVKQTTVLFNLCLGVSKVQTHLQLGIPHATIERCALRFESHISTYVEKVQDGIELGDGLDWADVECDEVTLDRRHIGAEQVTWSQYLGLIQRGRPNSLILIRLPEADWQPIHQKFIENKKIILHTDSARAYDAFTKGIGKTRVVHQVKKDSAGNWVRPHFTKYEEVKVEDGESIAVMAGTQYIDGFWRILRQEVLSHNGSNLALERRVRVAQWRYWTQRDDRWVALAATF